MSSVLARAAVISALVVCGAAFVAGRQPSTVRPIDVASLGPQIGQVVPPFTLNDQQGAPRALSSLLGPKGAILVFFRSADW
jgi:cytochrome oxidase Cu insertion factor (SCO1/SenC/PrrC family)